MIAPLSPPLSSPPGLLASFHRAAKAAAGLAAVIGGLSFVAWAVLDAEILRHLAPGLRAMHPATAVGLVLAASALWWEGRRGAQASLGLAVMAIGALRLVDAGASLDRWVFQAKVASVETLVDLPLRMAPTTALTFLSVGLALLLLASRRGVRGAQLLAFWTGLLALLATAGYAYGAHPLYGFAGFAQMALSTALAFLALAVGLLLARPEQGFMAVVSADSPAGAMLRRLLPPVFALPLPLGWLRLKGQEAGFYDLPTGSALYTLVTFLLLASLLWWSGRAVEREDRKRREAESALREARDGLEARVRERTAELATAEALTSAILASSMDAVITIDARGTVIGWNQAAERIFGYAQEEALGVEMATLIIPERLRGDHRRGIAHYLATGEGPVLRKLIRLPGMRKGGAEFPAEIFITPIAHEGQPMFSGFVRDITDRERAEGELRALTTELEQRVQERTARLDALNKELEAFAYSVSHDLRAPLRAIDGFSQALLEDYEGKLDEAGQDYLRRVRAASQRMAQLIEDILKLSRLTRGEMTWSRVDLSALAHEVATELSQGAPERHVTWEIAEGLSVEGDPRLLRVVLDNLLANAWKYTSKHATARIAFGVEARDGEKVYFVRDDGAGFDPAYADKLFQPFQRLHAPSEFPGTGIGLATVQRVVNRHGGRVWAEGAVEQGATFYFTLAAGAFTLAAGG